MSTWKEDNTLNKVNEKLRNSDYVKIIKLVNSQNPKYCFGIISACRGIQKDAADSNIITQKMIDDNNRINKKNTSLLFHNLAANYFHTIEVKGSYIEEGVGRVYETSYFIYEVAEKEDRLKEVLIELGKLFDQDSVMFISTENHTGQLIWLRKEEAPNWLVEFNNSKPHMNFSQDSLEEVFTRVGTSKFGRRFQIHEMQEQRLNYGRYTSWGYNNDPSILKCNRMHEDGYLEFFREAFKKQLNKNKEIS